MMKVVGPHLRIMRPWRLYKHPDNQAYKAPQSVYPIVQDITYYSHGRYQTTKLCLEVSWSTDMRLAFDAFNHTKDWRKLAWPLMSRRHG